MKFDHGMPSQSQTPEPGGGSGEKWGVEVGEM